MDRRRGTATAPPIHILVLWRTKRVTLTQRFGVLRLDGTTVTLFDREGVEQLSARGEELTATPVGKTTVRLVGPSDADQHLIVGPHTALVRNAKVKELITRFDPLVVPPRYLPMSDKKWEKMWRPATNPYTSGMDNMAQAAVWRPVLLQLLWSCHVAGAGQGDSPVAGDSPVPGDSPAPG